MKTAPKIAKRIAEYDGNVSSYNTVTEWRDFGLPCPFCKWEVEHLHSVITDSNGDQKLGMVTMRKDVFQETY